MELGVFIEEELLPKLILGTNPFLGITYRGRKSDLEYLKRFSKIENIVEVIIAATKKGARAVITPCDEKVLSAIKMAEDVTGIHLVMLGQIGYQHGRFTPMSQDLAILSQYDPEFIVLLAELTDPMVAFPRLLEKYIEEIRKFNSVPGIATHRPGETIPRIDTSGLDIKFILSPVNRAGFHMRPSFERTLEALRKTSKGVIAMKTLARGSIEPNEALGFVLNLPFVMAVALGVASVNEAIATFSTASAILKQGVLNKPVTDKSCQAK